MKIKVIGCGDLFSHRNYNQSFLVTGDNGTRLLIDCGLKIPEALHTQGIKLTDIDIIYISHLHTDHVGGLESVAFSVYDWVNKPRNRNDWRRNVALDKAKGKYIELIGNEKLLGDLWNNTLSGGLQSMEGFESKLDTFFEPHPIKSNEEIGFDGWMISLIQQVHIMAGNTIVPSFGIFFRREGRKSVYITTDSQHCSPRQIELFYKEADIIIQDCELNGFDSQKEELVFSSGVHANYSQLAGYPTANSTKLSDDIKAKMWLSHYQDFMMGRKDFFGNGCDWEKLAEKDGFAGFVYVGQEFEV